MDRREVVPEQHFTEPPPRYSEASLVKKLEELGIGRPSTYASIIEVLQRRNYVRLDRKRFIPEDRGRIVTAFLQTYFPRYVEYGFTAHLEEELDDISSGKIDWHEVLREFWKAFSAAVGETKELRVKEVLDKLDEELGPHFFPANDNGGKNPRDCPSCANGRLGLKLGKFGAFIGCSNYPECRFTRKLGIVDADADAASGENLDGPKILGIDPVTGKQVTLRKGPYGLYVQLGEPEGKEKPKRQSLLRDMTPNDLTLEKALALLALPRELGPHPEDGEVILAGVGRFGPYVKHGPKYKSIPSDESVLDIGMNRAVALLAEAKVPRGARRRQADPQHRQPSVRRGAGRALRRPLRPLREAWRRQRHGPARHQAGGADARPGDRAAGRARRQGRRQEAEGCQGQEGGACRRQRRRRQAQGEEGRCQEEACREEEGGQGQGHVRRPAPHRHRWLRARSRPATNCWPSSARAKRLSASARSRAPTG